MTTTSVSGDMLKRRIIVGCVDDPNKACGLVGLFPMSAEQQEREEMEAVLRLAALDSLAPLLMQIGDWVAETSTALQMEGVGMDVDSPFAHQFREMIQSVVIAALLNGTANLVDLGYLSVRE